MLLSKKLSFFKSNRVQYLVFAVLMLLAIVFSLWKIRYGFGEYGGYEEAFYISIPHRLFQGDSLLTEEWHLSQLSGFLLIPFVWTFELITKSTEGIFLAMRISYVVCHSLVSIFLYIRLRKYSYIISYTLFSFYTI